MNEQLNRDDNTPTPAAAAALATPPEQAVAGERIEVRRGRLVFDLPSHGNGKLEAGPFCIRCFPLCIRCVQCTCPPPTCVCTFNCVITAREAHDDGPMVL